MLHHCPNCSDTFLTSDHFPLCSWCGQAEEGKLELQERDEVVEWWKLMVWAEFGVRMENVRRWRIG